MCPGLGPPRKSAGGSGQGAASLRRHHKAAEGGALVELRSGLFLRRCGSGFPSPWGHRPTREQGVLVMAEGNELMSRLMSENADLKKQVRLLKENQMLKRLLSESCQESCSRSSRDLLFPKAPAYPEACSPTTAGEAPGWPGSGGLLLQVVPATPPSLRFRCSFCCVSSGEPVSPHLENGGRWPRHLSWYVHQRQAHKRCHGGLQQDVCDLRTPRPLGWPRQARHLALLPASLSESRLSRVGFTRPSV